MSSISKSLKKNQSYYGIKDLYDATHRLINNRVITDGEYMYSCGCLMGVENTAQSVVQTYKQGSLIPIAVEFLSDWQDRVEKENSWNKKPWTLLRDSSEASIALREGHSVMDIGGVVFFLQKVTDPDGVERKMVFSRDKDGVVKLAKPLGEFASWFDHKDFTLYNEEK